MDENPSIHASERPTSDLSRRQAPVSPEAGDRPRPRLVSMHGGEPAALQLAVELTEAITRCFQEAERQILSHAERARSSTLADLDRQRANVESLIEMFAERLQRQEVAISSLQEDVEGLLSRLDRQAEAIRALSEAREQHVQVLQQLMKLVRCCAPPLGNPTAPSGIST